jgi:hypothetical protein
LIVDEGAVSFVDTEFAYSRDVPLALMTARGLSIFIGKLRATPGEHPRWSRHSIANLMLKMSDAMGAPLRHRDVWAFAQFEAQLQFDYSGLERSPIRLLLSHYAPPFAGDLRRAKGTMRRLLGKAKRAAQRSSNTEVAADS